MTVASAEGQQIIPDAIKGVSVYSSTIIVALDLSILATNYNKLPTVNCRVRIVA